VPIETSLDRLLTGRTKLKYHEAGMDLGLASNPVESFRIFQSRVLDTYDEVTREFGLPVIDATNDIPTQQQQVREIVQDILADYEGPRGPAESNGTFR
jgi:dTMP kinase